MSPELNRNVATGWFAENESSGLMICGKNWGGDPDEEQRKETPSFFSDRSVNQYGYRTRIVEWFKLWGHPLADSPQRAGPFERSIIQTNWFDSQSPDMGDRSKHYELYLQGFHDFEKRLAVLRPKLIFFMTAQLLDAVNDKSCLPAVERVLGSHRPREVLTVLTTSGESRTRRFRAEAQRFANAQVVAMPHPERASYEFIKGLAPQISPMIARFKAERGFLP